MYRFIRLISTPFVWIGEGVLWILIGIKNLAYGQTRYGNVVRRLSFMFLAVLILFIYLVPESANRPIRGINSIIQEDISSFEQWDNISEDIRPWLSNDFAIPLVPEQDFTLGLDLQGGVRVVYDIDLSEIPSSDRENALESLRQVVQRRVDAFGISEPRVFIEEGATERLVVELAGLDNVEQALEQIGETPQLQFFPGRSEEEQEKITEENRTLLEEEELLERLENQDITAFQEIQSLNLQEPRYDDQQPPLLDGSNINRASLTFGQTGEPQVSVEFDNEGQDTFAEFTKENQGEQVHILLDGQVISSPRINEYIATGQTVISGGFTREQARSLVDSLNAGALPAPISIANQNTIEPSLGTVALEKSLQAASIGILLVAIYMLVVYRLLGGLTLGALAIYIIIVLSVMKLSGFTFTLAGITGILVSVGLAVDGNILIFERLKEELQRGHTFNYAQKEAFTRAWRSIRDSQISTLISALILFYLTSGMVQGFAISLALGVTVSLFTAVTVTRMMTIILGYQSWIIDTRWGRWLILDKGNTRL